jgi:major membrane immunogen (membrane-anchored lipoprotein)
MFRSLWILGVVAGALLLSACAASPAARRSVDERLFQTRQALTQLRAGPGAEQVEPQFQRAEMWLRKAETRHADPDADLDRVGLLIEVARGQLVQAKAELARLEAAADLKARQADYVKQTDRLEAIRTESATLRREEKAR